MGEIRIRPRKNPLQFLIFKRPLATVEGQLHALRTPFVVTSPGKVEVDQGARASWLLAGWT